MQRRGVVRMSVARQFVLAAALCVGGADVVRAQVPCSGNAGGLNERRYSIAPADITVGAAQVTALRFDAGHVVVTQQVQVNVDLVQETHFIALCLHADYLGSAGARSLPVGDIEWRRVSPDPMANFVTVSQNTPAPVIGEQAVGSLTAVFEFRIRLRWASHIPGTYGTGLFWTAYRNRPNT
jgi:hypothetical protein